MNNDLISRSALKEHKFVGNKYVQIGGRTNGKTIENMNQAYQLGWNDAIDAIIDNAPTVPLPDFKEGYKQAIIDGKTNFSRPQGEWLHPYKSDIACECSNCHIQMPITDYFNFCPNCGTQMKGGAE